MDHRVFNLNEKVKNLTEEYLKTENPEILRLMVRTQINEIYPEIRNRRMLENEVVELDSEIVKNRQIFSIFKYPIEVSKIFKIIGEEPRVIKYEI